VEEPALLLAHVSIELSPAASVAAALLHLDEPRAHALHMSYIKGVDSVIFNVESGEYRLLSGVYYIPTLRNSIISLGQLDESSSRVEIKDGVMRIWDRHCRLLAKVTRGINRLYVLNVQVAQPLCLALVGTTRRGSGMSASGTFTSRPRSGSVPRGWYEACRALTTWSSSAMSAC
jgi:hypothetical protein